MPTKKNRVSVVLEDNEYELLTDLSRLTGETRAALIRQFIRPSIPVLEQVRDVLLDGEKAIEKMNEVPVEFAEMFREQFVPQAEKALNHMQKETDSVHQMLIEIVQEVSKKGDEPPSH